MSSNLSRQYAKALFDLASEKREITEVYNNLQVSKKAFENPDFKKIMNSAVISKEEKKAILKKIFLNLSDSYFLYFHYVLIDNGRFEVYDQIVDAYKELLQEYQKTMDIDVYTKFNLNEVEKQQIKRNLDQRFSKNVSISYHIDPELIGGIKIVADGLIIDYSLDTQLKKVKESIMKG